VDRVQRSHQRAAQGSAPRRRQDRGGRAIATAQSETGSLYDQIKELLDANDEILIFGHKDADGDTLGCSLAFAEALRTAGKHVWVLIPHPLPDMYSFLPGFGDIHEGPPSGVEPQLVFFFDSGNLERSGRGSWTCSTTSGTGRPRRSRPTCTWRSSPTPAVSVTRTPRCARSRTRRGWRASGPIPARSRRWSTRCGRRRRSS